MVAVPAPSVLERPEVEETTSENRPWVVIVWNDPINLMSYVTFVFQKLFGYSLEKATSLMLDVHEKGRAVGSNGPREKAEVDVLRLHEHGLWATMQQDDCPVARAKSEAPDERAGRALDPPPRRGRAPAAGIARGRG